MTTLNQVFAQVSVHGTVAGELVQFDAPGVFEFIRATTLPSVPSEARVRVSLPEAKMVPAPSYPSSRILSRALVAERPRELAKLCEILAGRTLAIAVEGERIAVSFYADRVVCARRAGPATVHLGMQRQLIADVIRARTSLASALVDGRLAVTGPIDEIALLHQGLMVYVHGAIRAPSFPALWQRFRALLPEAER